jgi:diguanylate cyclase (GGDEF)-like protein
MEAAIPADDDARVAALHRYGILDQPRTPDLEAITRLATFVAGSEMAVINLIDRHRQWQAAATGMEPGEVPRSSSMCSHVVAEDGAIYTPDASADDRFRDNPFVTGEIAEVRFYVGTPIRDRDGAVLGSLCVADTSAKELSQQQLDALADLAEQTMSLFELHHRTDRLTGMVTELDHLAAHDALTGLANRRRFTEELAQRIRDRDGVSTVIFGDLDGFKAVNDEHGHQAGDVVLQTVARRLAAEIRPEDLVARLGGDEFAVLCFGLAEQDAGGLMDRLRAVVAEPIEVGGATVTVGLSVGVADSFDGQGLDDLLRTADARMYDDKAARVLRTA